MFRWRGLCVLCGWLLATLSRAGLAADARSMVEADINGVRVEGRMLYQHEQQLSLLARDGHWWTCKPAEATNTRSSSDDFRPYTASEMRARLAREMGDRFEVSGTRHFIVAYPKGQQEIWPQRFEELYGSCVHYFSIRGFTLSEPEFPLIAIVWRNRDEFRQAAKNEGAQLRDDVIGYYWQVTNRLMMYDLGGNATHGKNWQDTADTIIHEATHQTAFNTGIHNRFVNSPGWVAEGLATMFEPRGVHDSRNYPDQADRINRARLIQFRQFQVTKRSSDSIQDLVTSDQRFKDNSTGAYAEAWALTFYLVETMPRDYAQYLQKTAQRPQFKEYTASDRYADFVSVFGKDFRMLDARFIRYLKDIQ